jgi:hypothetical protein
MTVGPNPVPMATPVPGTKVYLKRTQTLNNTPGAGDIEHGELWMNYHSGSPRLYFKDNANEIVEIKPSGAGANPPLTGNETGDLWFDGDNLLVWNGSSWQVVGVTKLEDLDDTDVAGAQANNVLAYDGSKWVAVSAASIAIDVDLAYTARAGDGEVTNTAGDNATIPARTDTLAGLMLPGDKTKVDSIPAGGFDDYLQAGDNITELNNNAGYLTEAEINNILNGNNPDGTPNPGGTAYLKPGDNGTELTNDAGYITAADIPAGVENLDDLGDVNVTSAQSGQILKYDGANWHPANPATADISGSELNDLGDVNAPGPQVDQHLAWNGSKWVAVDPPAEFSGSYNDLTDQPNIPDTLNDLSDVSADSPSVDQVLQWNGTAWVPGDVEGGGLEDTVVTGLVWVNALPTAGQVAGGPDLTTNADKSWATRTSFVLHLSSSLASIIPGQTLSVKNVTQNQTAEYTVTSVDTGLNGVFVSYVSDTGGDIKAGNAFELTFGFADGAGTGTVTKVDSGDGLTGGPITDAGTLSVQADGDTITVGPDGIKVTDGKFAEPGDIPDVSVYLPLAGGEMSGSVTTPEQTVTSIAFDLSAGPFWLIPGGIDVPDPINAVAGMSGLIRFTAAPTSWGSAFQFAGGTPVAPTKLPAVSPFYVQASGSIYVGPAVEELI